MIVVVIVSMSTIPPVRASTAFQKMMLVMMMRTGGLRKPIRPHATNHGTNNRRDVAATSQFLRYPQQPTMTMSPLVKPQLCVPTCSTPALAVVI